MRITLLWWIFFIICSLLKPDKYSGKRRGACASEISTIGSENQVKTYMDSSNGVRNASSNAYNKVRASAVSLTLRTRWLYFQFWCLDLSLYLLWFLYYSLVHLQTSFNEAYILSTPLLVYNFQACIAWLVI